MKFGTRSVSTLQFGLKSENDDVHLHEDLIVFLGRESPGYLGFYRYLEYHYP